MYEGIVANGVETNFQRTQLLTGNHIGVPDKRRNWDGHRLKTRDYLCRFGFFHPDASLSTCDNSTIGPHRMELHQSAFTLTVGRNVTACVDVDGKWIANAEVLAITDLHGPPMQPIFTKVL